MYKCTVAELFTHEIIVLCVGDKRALWSMRYLKSHKNTSVDTLIEHITFTSFTNAEYMLGNATTM
jgi:hypothetical protein